MIKMTKPDPTYLPEVSLKLPIIPLEILNISYNAVEVKHVEFDYPPSVLPFSASMICKLPIRNACYMTSGDDGVKTVMKMSFDNKDALFTFQPGDTIGILPENNIQEVNELLQLLNISNKADEQYTLTLRSVETKKKITFPIHIPPQGTLRDVILHCIDIRSVLKKILICALSTYTEDAVERRCIEEICSREGAHLYTKQILEKNVSILDFLKRFPSCQPPITLLIQQLPRLAPRPYSICNSALSGSNLIEICFSVVNIDSHKKGITTGWLEQIVKLKNKSCDQSDTDEINKEFNKLKISDSNQELTERIFRIPIYMRKSNSFVLPGDHSTPIVMVGPGTGVAPFIGFLEEKRALKIKNPDLKFGSTFLYFGCRYSKKDFIFKDELDGFLNDGTLSKLRVSHSREGDGDIKYIQDNLLLDADIIVDLLQNKLAVMYVCGDLSTMGKQVTECLIECFKKVFQINDSEAEGIVKDLKDNNRYILDIWV